MKAEAAQQRSLIQLTEIDADLSRLEHRAKHLAEQDRLEPSPPKHRDANDGLAAVNIALEDISG
jgi:predicted  nucleic acid-binding Zn-ribbon protein